MMKPIGLMAAGFALAANAFMIPSTMSLPDLKADGLEAVHAIQDTASKALGSLGLDGKSKNVKLGCPGCTFPGASEGDQLHLFWQLSDDHKTLSLNGIPYFKNGEYVGAQAHYPVQQVEAIEFHNPSGLVNAWSSKRREMMVSTASRRVAAGDGTDEQIIDMDLSLYRLDNEDVAGADGITITLMKDAEDGLAIIDVVKVPGDGAAPQAEEEDKEVEEEQMFSILPIDNIAPAAPNGAPETECEGRLAVVCRAKAVLDAKVAEMREKMSNKKEDMHRVGRPGRHHPCPGKMGKGGPHGVKGGVAKIEGLMKGKNGPGPHHGHHGPHGPRRMCAHRMMHRLFHGMARFFFGIVVPVMIGVATGMTACLLGMVVGTGLAMLWTKVVRKGRKGNASGTRVEDTRHEAAAPGEKQGLMETAEAEHEEGLPAYEEKQ